MAEFANGATWGYDADARVADTDPAPTYVDVAEIVNISLNGPNQDTLDVSVHDNEWRRFVGGLANAGSATMEVRFTSDNNSHRALMDLVKRSTPMAMRIRGPNIGANRWEFKCDGFITNASPSFPHDGVASMSLSVQFSGEPILPAQIT